MATSKSHTIVIDGGGQNYLAGRCPPIEVKITVKQGKLAKKKTTRRKTAKK